MNRNLMCPYLMPESDPGGFHHEVKAQSRTVQLNAV